MTDTVAPRGETLTDNLTKLVHSYLAEEMAHLEVHNFIILAVKDDMEAGLVVAGSARVAAAALAVSSKKIQAAALREQLEELDKNS